MSRTTYHRYLRAAKLKGCDPAMLYSMAGFSPLRRAQLVSVLREHHGFKLHKRDRDALIDALLDDDVDATRIANLLGCHPRTVARRSTLQVGVTGRMDKRCQRDKTEVRGSSVTPRGREGPDRPPILSFYAAGGGDDLPLIRKVLQEGRR